MRASSQTDNSIAAAVTRGTCRLFAEHGWGTVIEFRLPHGRRVDVMAMDEKGRFAIVEVKSSLADFRADGKWQDYLPYCDLFYFAVPDGFPLDVLPDGHGLIVADGYGAAIRRPAPETALNAARRRRQIVRFGHAASQRLQRLADAAPLGAAAPQWHHRSRETTRLV